MEELIINGMKWVFRAVQSVFGWLIAGLKWFHDNDLRLVTTYPKQTTVFLEIVVGFLLFMIVFTVTRKPKAKAPEAAKLAKTDVSWNTNWKAIGIAVGVVLALAVVLGLLK